MSPVQGRCRGGPGRRFRVSSVRRRATSSGGPIAPAAGGLAPLPLLEEGGGARELRDGRATPRVGTEGGGSRARRGRKPRPHPTHTPSYTIRPIGVGPRRSLLRTLAESAQERE